MFFFLSIYVLLLLLSEDEVNGDTKDLKVCCVHLLRQKQTWLRTRQIELKLGGVVEGGEWHICCLRLMKNSDLGGMESSGNGKNLPRMEKLSMRCRGQTHFDVAMDYFHHAISLSMISCCGQFLMPWIIPNCDYSVDINCSSCRSYIKRNSKKRDPAADDGSCTAWPTTACNFKTYEGMTIKGYDYYTSTNSSENDCKDRCVGEKRCGSYRWCQDDLNGDRCYLYQMTPKLLEKATGIGEEKWIEESTETTSCKLGAKECEAEIPKYKYTYTRQYNGTMLSFIYRITKVDAYPSNNLTVTACHLLCNMYESCQSVTYFKPTSCYLYNISMAEVINSNGTLWYSPSCITYDKGTIITTTTTTTTPTTTTTTPTTTTTTPTTTTTTSNTPWPSAEPDDVTLAIIILIVVVTIIWLIGAILYVRHLLKKEKQFKDLEQDNNKREDIPITLLP